MSTTDDTIRSVLVPRVVRGAQVLDVHDPDWYRSIDLGKLSMSSCERCVVGQAIGEFSAGLKTLGIFEPENFGFEMPYCEIADALDVSDSYLDYLPSWRVLEELWTDVVKTRFAEATI